MTSITIRLAGIGLSFAQGALTARLLGAQGYGLVAVAIAIAQIGATLALFGLGGLAVREIPQRLAAGDAAGATAFMRFACVVVLLFSLPVMLASGVFVHREVGFPSALGGTAWLAVLLVAPLAFLQLFRGMAQGLGRIAQAQWPSDMMRPAMMAGALGIAALLGFGLAEGDYLLWTLICTIAAALAGGVAVWRARPAVMAPASKDGRSFGWLAQASPFLGLGLLTMLQAEINTLLLGLLAGPEQTGLFQPVARIAALMVLPVQAAGMGFAPRAAALWHGGERVALARLTATFTWSTTLLTAGLAAALALSAPWLLLLFGSEFTVVAPLLGYLALAQVCNAACGPVGMLLTMSAQSSQALLGHGLALLANALLGWALIPNHGAMGAALAMSAGILVWNIVNLAQVWLRLGIRSDLVAALARSDRH